ncbi:hypothetical protein C4K14_4141 [Pseudomonas chlororaphis subsp. aureofaciens]|uniref:hypothetical protein n=1 Tax=Pseudomonas chlororaphis TaxID=587753 RepID=UPI000F6E3796|nr:hypothetical protein [Pseudomonas chlororaphis]AZD86963.1 hypothetical protein C4K14_4141 [Pseudomonas chlororaphis subsp. aureofaciens]
MRKSTFTLLLFIAAGISIGAYQVFKAPAYRATSAVSHCGANPCYLPNVNGLIP